MSKPPKTAPARPQIGRFVLSRKLGKGGQGTVFLADDPSLERKVAIKVIDQASMSSDIEPGTIPREARMAARMQHPGIVSIYDVGHFRGRPYLVFEFVEGRTFREILRDEGALPRDRALAFMRSVIQGMAHAHERGVLHLDLTPGNVLLSAREVPRIMDFGLAQFVTTVRDTTAMPVGTLLYMAPEQLEEQPVGPPCDVRALGLILYELLTGETAIGGRTVHKAACEICDQDIDLSPIETGADMVPVADFLAVALARDPDARYPNAVAMLQAFDAALEARNTLLNAEHEAPSSGAVDFLLRRLRRRKDFPALSRSLTEINRMTAGDSNANANELATVVLRDVALTNNLLKLANSAYYANLAGGVKSVSHAISLLGFEHLRVMANSLVLFAHVSEHGKDPGLQDLLIRSFMAGLIARHLARRDGLPGAEEAFICGMFQTLGELMCLFYFGEEHADIVDLTAHGRLTRHQASIQVLGTDYATLGAAIAQEWRFPKLIVDAIAGVPPGIAVPAPTNDDERLRDIAAFADALCEVLGAGEHDAGERVFDPLVARFQASIAMAEGEVPALVAPAMEKLEAQAGVLEVNVHSNGWCTAARACITNAVLTEDSEMTVEIAPWAARPRPVTAH